MTRMPIFLLLAALLLSVLLLGCGSQSWSSRRTCLPWRFDQAKHCQTCPKRWK